MVILSVGKCLYLNGSLATFVPITGKNRQSEGRLLLDFELLVEEVPRLRLVCSCDGTDGWVDGTDGWVHESAHGTSRHFAAVRNLVAAGAQRTFGQLRTNQARFMSTRPGRIGHAALEKILFRTAAPVMIG
jgi:hypothetical protein